MEALKSYFESIGGEVYNIATYGTETAKAALQTATRGLNYDSDLGTYLSSMIPVDRGRVRTLKECMYGDDEKGFKPIPSFVGMMREHPDIWQVAEKIEGLICKRGLHACFDENTLITTKDGLKTIKDIQIGESVLTHKNKYQRVADTITSEWNITYNLKAVGIEATNTTATHPFLIRHKLKDTYSTINGKTKRIHHYSSPNWVQVEDLKPNQDYIGILVNDKEELPVLTYDLDYSKEEFWWIIGRYLGDGWTENRQHKLNNKIHEEHQVIICCNKDMKKNEKQTIITQLEKLNYTYRVEEARTTYKIYIKQPHLWEFLQLFGKYAYGKFIPNFVINLPKELLISLFEGYISADGYKVNNKTIFKTTSEKLILGISQIINKIYHKIIYISVIEPRTDYIEGRLVDCKKIYQGVINFNPRYERCFYENNYIWCPVTKIEVQVGYKKMYNLSIENDNSYLANTVAVHNCGTLIVNEDFVKHNASMKAPNKVVCSQYELHDSEQIGGLKFDALTTDALDRIRTAMDLLLKYGYMEWKGDLKSTYNHYLSPRKLDYDNMQMWQMVGENKISNLFQYDTPVGLASAKKIEPHSVVQLAVANSLMRLMGEDGAEMPTDTYARYKKDISLWYAEMRNHKLTEEEIKVLEKHLLPLFGVADSQESLMLLSMDPKVSNFTVVQANKLRKTIAKKKLADIDALHQMFVDQGTKAGASMNLLNYVWDVQVKRQLGYSFSVIHSMGYSIIALQEMNLATKYPMIFWNCANLIVDSQGIDEQDSFETYIENFEDDDEEVEEMEIDEDDEETEVVSKEEKKKVKPIKYGKIASAIGKMKSLGVEVSLPDINKSGFTFTPDIENNTILFGIKGISKINDTIAKDIINNRPYTSIADFQSKVKVGKLPMINLIKSGAFDNIEKKPREEIMKEYIDSVSDKKKKLTLQNMPGLIREHALPEEFDFERRVYNFNKYLKTLKYGEIYYELNEKALTFYENNFNMDFVSQIEDKMVIKITQWDKIYKANMENMKKEFKDNPAILDNYNAILFDAIWNKYANGTISKWEMDSVSFYFHEHELSVVKSNQYYIDDFEKLNEEPEVDKIWETKDGKQIPIFKLHRIIGTVIDKDKTKNIVTLLTTSGVVLVKVYRTQFGKYDKQISVKDDSGKKKVIEKSWFSRGNKIMISGIRRENFFVPKVYANNPIFEYPFELVSKIENDGSIEVYGERAE